LTPWFSAESYYLIYCKSIEPVFNFYIVLLRPFNPRMRDVILSRDLLAAAPLIIISTPSAAA